MDAVTFGLQLADYSIGRVNDRWQLTQPTPNADNVAVALASSTNVSLNEWLANSVPGGSDWLELFNRSSNAPVALQGLYVGTSNNLFPDPLALVPAAARLRADAGRRERGRQSSGIQTARGGRHDRAL